MDEQTEQEMKTVSFQNLHETNQLVACAQNHAMVLFSINICKLSKANTEKQSTLGIGKLPCSEEDGFTALIFISLVHLTYSVLSDGVRV